MIIEANDIRKIRPVGTNVDDEKLTYYIEEAINLLVIPSIGAKLYKQIDENPQDNQDILEEFYYNDDTFHHNGLKKATAYLAYERFLQNNAVNPTTYGVDYLQSEYSQKASTEDITYQRNQAKEIGLQYLEEVKKYLVFSGKLQVCNCQKHSKFQVIG